MNGIGGRNHSAASSYDSRAGNSMPGRPSAKAMLNGYDPNAPTGHLGYASGTMNHGGNAPTSNDLDPQDPAAIHLLMETALGDSQQYSILSMNQAEDLKRELPRLENRIEATKRQLAIETKVRDAASNLSRLDRGARRGTASRIEEQGDEDIAAANQKCELLAQELWQLEKRHQEVQRQLLAHTAGILSRTHKGFLESEPKPQRNGIDGHSQPRGLDFTDSTNLDDQSFYHALDSLLDIDVGGGGGDPAAFKKQNEAIMETERKLSNFNQQLREAIAQASSGRSNIPDPPAQSSGHDDSGLQDQIAYMERGFDHFQRTHVENLQSHRSASQKLEDNMNTVREQANDHEQKARGFEDMLQGLWPTVSDGEKFSTDAFAAKVASLSTRVADLGNQKDILKRQIEQQREINNKSDGEKDAKMTSMNTELEESRKKAEDAIKATEATKQEMQEVEGELVRLQTEVTIARAELDGAYGTRAQRAAEVAQHPELQSQITGLRQELETAQVKASETEQLQQQAQTLRKELSETITEYEAMTKASIEFERERETLENAADGLRDRCEALEVQLNEEKLHKLGAKSPGTPGDRGSNERGVTSTTVLRNEFKKMMRDSRAESMKALRHEQEERRKLEAQLRELKKSQAPGKSSLSQSMTAS